MDELRTIAFEEPPVSRSLSHPTLFSSASLVLFYLPRFRSFLKFHQIVSFAFLLRLSLFRSKFIYNYSLATKRFPNPLADSSIYGVNTSCYASVAPLPHMYTSLWAGKSVNSVL